jgi:putative SOS response-associated peptidase YedK
MCNDYEQHVRYAEYCKMMQDLALKVPRHETELDLPQYDDVKIGDVGPVIRATEPGTVQLTQMKFGFPPPAGRKGGPVFNFRSEGRHFADSQRCLIPASAFFEFTGSKYPKAKHRFTLNGAPFFAIAGLWRDEEGNQPPSFAMLTTGPGPDVAPIHSRQIVILKPDNWRHWLDLTKPEGELLRSLPSGSLAVEQVRPGSD